jgi:hypothetical protein
MMSIIGIVCELTVGFVPLKVHCVPVIFTIEGVEHVVKRNAGEEDIVNLLLGVHLDREL